MNRIEAEYVPGSEEQHVSGMGDVICPACGKRVCESDMHGAQEEGTDREIEVCDDCLIEAEKVLCVRFDADVLPPETFSRLWEHVLPIVEERRATEPPQTITQLARMLGGHVRRGGDGNFLALVSRNDGHLVAISGACIAEYASEDALREGRALIAIRLE